MDTRASDEDRRRIMAALERHVGAGRLTLDEFAERARVAYDARTLADLAELTRDLPAEEPRRELYFVFAVAAATLLLFGLFMVLR